MAGTIALDDVEITENTPEISEAPVINTTDAEVPVKEEVKEETVTTEVIPETKPESFVVDGKEYTKEQAAGLISKIGRYQGDRDRAEAALEKFTRQIAQQGFEVTPDLSLRKREEVARPNKEALAEAAVLGDVQALKQLLDIHGKEVLSNVSTGMQQSKAIEQIYTEVIDKYPDFYAKGEDGKVARDMQGNPVPNPESPLFTEALQIIDRYPGLAQAYALPVLAEMAENRLLKKNLPKMEQQIKDKVLEKTKTVKSMSVASSTPSVSGDEISIDPEVLRASTNLGVSSDRISKIMEKATKNGGYYL